MKKLILISLTAVAVFMAGCSDSEPEPYSFMSKHYITSYGIVGSMLGYQELQASNYIWIGLGSKGYVEYRANGMVLSGERPGEFEAVAKRFGDTNYNKMNFYYAGMDGASNKHSTYLTDFKSITISSDVTAFDADHPAGSSLNDIVKVYITSYLSFIRSGYKEFDWDSYTGDFKYAESYKYGNRNLHLIEKLASELTPDDLALIDSFYFEFIVPPPSGEYYLRIVADKTDGGRLDTTVNVKL